MLFKEWHFIKKMSGFILTSIVFESLQYMLAVGISDITDVIHNVLGGLIGLIIYEVVENIVRDHQRAQNMMNVVALLGTVSMISILLVVDIYYFI